MNSLQHVAFIMDGNRRWASRHGVARIVGHKEGILAIERVISGCHRSNIPYATFYAFSKENWSREPWEVTYLMRLMRYYLLQVQGVLSSDLMSKTKVRFIGQREDLFPEIQEHMRSLEAHNPAQLKCLATVAVSYSGQDDIIEAASLAASAGYISKPAIDQYLSTVGIPYPDAIVRTGGVQRLSNFLTWESIYSELIFLEELWPDMSEDHVESIKVEYFKRDRRFGK